MGNTENRGANRKLGVPIVGKIESSLSRSSGERGMVLGCYILYPDNTVTHPLSRLFHVILVTPKAIEMYCLLTGEKRHPRYIPSKNSTIVSSVLSNDFISSVHLIIAESNGGFATLNAYSLNVDRRIGLSHSLPALNATKNVIFTMISIAPEILYVGYLSGVVKVWHTEVGNPQFVFGKEYEQPPVRSLAYSAKHRKIVIGYEGTYENQHGRFIKIEKSVLRVYVPNATEEDSECVVLEGFSGTCFSVGILDKLDLVVAISSDECGLYAWSLISYSLDLKINLPRLDKQPQVITQLLIIERPDTNYLILGLSDGSVLISGLLLEGGKIVWKPLKKLVVHLENNYAIEYLKYEEKIDTLILGNTYATASFISNFFSDALNQELSVEGEIQIDEL